MIKLKKVNIFLSKMLCKKWEQMSCKLFTYSTAFDGNYPANKTIVKKKGENKVSWRKTLNLKSGKQGFTSFFLVL